MLLVYIYLRYICHPERKGPQTPFSLGVVSRRICCCSFALCQGMTGAPGYRDTLWVEVRVACRKQPNSNNGLQPLRDPCRERRQAGVSTPAQNSKTTVGFSPWGTAHPPAIHNRQDNPEYIVRLIDQV